jgi:Mrp family chromosome partitioning ATPase
LAAALSETGEGNVLLLDLNLEQGSAHQFFRGQPLLGLGEVLEKEKRDSAQVQGNLYLASLRDSNGVAKPSVPTKRIADLIPKLRAADYDYIIFDMPPVSHTGITYRLSSYLDRTLMVVEAEKTQRNVLHEAYQLLQQSGSNVTAVLNKQRTYVPNRLHQQLDGNHSS